MVAWRRRYTTLNPPVLRARGRFSYNSAIAMPVCSSGDESIENRLTSTSGVICDL